MSYANYIDPKYRIPFEYVANFEPMYNACYECLTGVMWKASAQNFCFNLDQIAYQLSMELLYGIYRSNGFSNFKINERGKIRDIHSVHITERAVQKSLVQNGLRPIIAPRLISANCATLPGRGTDYALDLLRIHLFNHVKEHGLEGGILTMDYHAYYDSVVHSILLNDLRQIIWDDRIFMLSQYFIDMFTNMEAVSKHGFAYNQVAQEIVAETQEESVSTCNEDEEYMLEKFGPRGLGLGSEISQITAIFYPNPIDHYIKEQLRIKGYARYMDDSYLISNDLGYLNYCKDVITDMSLKRGLVFNPNKLVITPFKSGKGNSFVYLKKHCHFTNTGKLIMEISDKAITKHRQQLLTQYELFIRGRMTIDEVYQSFMCWRESVKKYNSRNSLFDLTQLFFYLFRGYINPVMKDKLNNI